VTGGAGAFLASGGFLDPGANRAQEARWAGVETVAASQRDEGFKRRLRLLKGGGSGLNTLSDRDCCTVEVLSGIENI